MSGCSHACQADLTSGTLSGNLDVMDNTTEFSEEKAQVDVTLTLADDWRSNPLRIIAGLREGHRSLEEWQRKAVAVAREQGRTWDEIGAACGVSRQAAWERFSTD